MKRLEPPNHHPFPLLRRALPTPPHSAISPIYFYGVGEEVFNITSQEYPNLQILRSAGQTKSEMAAKGNQIGFMAGCPPWLLVHIQGWLLDNGGDRAPARFPLRHGSMGFAGNLWTSVRDDDGQRNDIACFANAHPSRLVQRRKD